MTMGQGGSEGWGLCPHPTRFCLAPSPPHLAQQRKFSSPISAPCPTISTIFLMKPISLKKLYLKLQLNLSHQIKSIFRKKINNISKCLTRQSLKKKKKIS